MRVARGPQTRGSSDARCGSGRHGATTTDRPQRPNGDLERPARVVSVLPALVRGRLRDVLAQAARAPRLGSGPYWLAQLGQLLADEPTGAPMLAELERLLDDYSPRVLVYGDYNAGKSSFVRRLLVDDGQPVPRH